MKARSSDSTYSVHLIQRMPRASFLFLFLSFLFLASRATAQQQAEPTPYDLLQLYGFPAGLLPDTVVSGTIHSNGRFEVHLSRKCFEDIPGAYPVSYDTKISGIISEGRMSELSGVTVKAFFVWWPITEIYVSGNNLVFTIGIASASYPASNFRDSPTCGHRLIESM